MSHNQRKRRSDSDSPRPEPTKKRSSPPLPSDSRRKPRPTFPSYLDSPNLPPKTRLLCEIIASTPSSSIESALSDTGVRVSSDDVEEVLKLSYSYPGPAVKFFRWAGSHLHDHHSPYAWNLVVDLLGKNLLFDAMWDAMKSMRDERLLSLATFASVFSSYAAASRPDEALMTFEVMEQYGIPRDVAALNSLLSATCREAQTVKARDFLNLAQNKIAPDGDTYAILLEGWESEGDIRNARETFGEMIVRLGWDPVNLPAYDSFLSTLIRGPGGLVEAMKFLGIMREKRCFPGMKFFRNALEEFFKQKDANGAISVWDVLFGRNGCYPDTGMYNSMIALQCYLNQTEVAYRFFDEMVSFGAFPDAQTYNVMLQFLLKGRKLREAAVLFNEMVKNDFSPSSTNRNTAIRHFLDSGDWEAAVKVWKNMIGNSTRETLEENGNLLVCKLRDLDRLPEACKYAVDMIERGIKLNSSTLSKLKTDLTRVGKGNIYDELLRKWKSR